MSRHKWDIHHLAMAVDQLSKLVKTASEEMRHLNPEELELVGTLARRIHHYTVKHKGAKP